MLRSRLPSALAFLFAFPFVVPGCRTRPPAAATLPGILWQRTLEDAEALAAAEHRPLFIAVNMDGESASDRIWCENYRDPEFIAAANRCVCVAASVFRHNARDYEMGRRIVCPRFGCITCGEHMAMEPALFRKQLADGERVAPRHALVMPDGRKAFDLSLCFDLHDVDRALFAAVRGLGDRRWPSIAGASWEQLAAQRDQAARSVLEERFAAAGDDEILPALRALASAGDRGALDVLRIAILPQRRQEWFIRYPVEVDLRRDLIAVARQGGVVPGFATVVREQLEIDPRYDDFPSARTWVGDDDRGLMALLAELDPNDEATRWLLLAHTIIEPDSAQALSSLRGVLPAEQMAAVETVAQAGGGAVDLRAAMREVPSAVHSAPTGDEMPEVEALVRELEALEQTPAAARDAAWHARYAKASLDLGRRHLDAQQKDAQLLLEDAEQHWSRALGLEPGRPGWWIERARTAYFLGKYADEAAFGQHAYDLTGVVAQFGQPLTDVAAIEALRWVADGHTRVLGERAAAGDPAVELQHIATALRAHLDVAVSLYGSARDWLTLASFCGSIGLARYERLAWERGVQRFPGDRDLRILRNDLEVAEQRSGANADAEWWAGSAWIATAEIARNRDLGGQAIAAYEIAAAHFGRAMAARAEYADSCLRMIALTWLDRGFANVFGKRAVAADCLVEAVRVQPHLADLRDGLGCDVLDLVDKILEWRDAGPSDVDPRALLDRLLAAAPGDPFYGLAIADALLREALRADGRNPVRAERDTVDAAGTKIRMMMGLPTGEGDRCLDASIAAARQVLPFTTAPDDQKVLAQSDTILAERNLERHRLDGVAAALAEAAALLGETAPELPDEPALTAFAAHLRALLGDARPRLREGR